MKHVIDKHQDLACPACAASLHTVTRTTIEVPDDGTTSHEYAGHAPGSYESSARAFTYAAVGIVACLLGAIVCAWVRNGGAS